MKCTSPGIKVFFLFILFIISSCKKYEEGPGFSIHTRKNRLVKEWTITSFSRNGINQFYTVNDGNILCQYGYPVHYTNRADIDLFTWKFEKDNSWIISQQITWTSLNYQVSFGMCNSSYNRISQNYSENGTWKFTHKKGNIELTFNSDGRTEEWEIIQLRDKRMILQQNENSVIVFESK